jgi:activator of 2-hydroxyglutaryl-CoA dehydratase
MATRIAGLAKRVGIEKDVVLSGGVAKNIGFAKILEEETEAELRIPEEPQLIAALGAALIAREGK